MADGTAETTDKVLGTRDAFMESLSVRWPLPHDTASTPPPPAQLMVMTPHSPPPQDPQKKLAAASVAKYMQRDIDLAVGSPFRDAPLASIDGDPLLLSTLAQPGRPLLLNFGSCS